MEQPLSCSPKSPTDKRFVMDDAAKYGLGSFIPAEDLKSEKGDLIEVDRTLYTDWAVNDGDIRGEIFVIHVSGIRGEDIPTGNKAVVRRDSLRDIVGNSGVRVNNKFVGAKERTLQSFPTEEVLTRAREHIDQTVDYNLLSRNAEHLMTEWKYGQGWSDQASVAISVIKSLQSDKVIAHQQLLQSLTAILGTPCSLGTPRSPTLDSTSVPTSARSTSGATTPNYGYV